MGNGHNYLEPYTAHYRDYTNFVTLSPLLSQASPLRPQPRTSLPNKSPHQLQQFWGFFCLTFSIQTFPLSYQDTLSLNRQLYIQSKIFSNTITKALPLPL